MEANCLQKGYVPKDCVVFDVIYVYISIVLVKGHYDHRQQAEIAGRRSKRSLTHLTTNCGKILDYYTTTNELEILPWVRLVNSLIRKLKINYQLKASYISDYYKTYRRTRGRKGGYTTCRVSQAQKHFACWQNYTIKTSGNHFYCKKVNHFTEMKTLSKPLAKNGKPKYM